MPKQEMNLTADIKDFLLKHYLSTSLMDLGRELNVSHTTIRKWLTELQIKKSKPAYGGYKKGEMKKQGIYFEHDKNLATI